MSDEERTEQEESEEVEEPSSPLADQLVAALESLKTADGDDYIEILSRSESSEQVRLRLRTYDLEAWTHHFLPVVFKEELRVASRPEDRQWALHICRQYMYDEEGRKLKFFWNFIVSSADVAGAVGDLCRLTDMFVTHLGGMEVASREAPKKRKQRKSESPPDLLSTDLSGVDASGIVFEDGRVISIPLLGGSSRNMPEGGLFEKGKSPKGAHAIGGSR